MAQLRVPHEEPAHVLYVLLGRLRQVEGPEDGRMTRGYVLEFLYRRIQDLPALWVPRVFAVELCRHILPHPPHGLQAALQLLAAIHDLLLQQLAHRRQPFISFIWVADLPSIQGPERIQQLLAVLLPPAHLLPL